ncbi:glycosyltransferase [Nocardioides daejeonensis]|uniref:glycosyltransferase n=1 Tax=Nocardioides daejeonensis TaxID=1046556 RepID=UPI000D741B47|nr:glycosyltransferase [Nocardioides daejeonensis]
MTATSSPLPIGQALLRAGLIDEAQLDAALTRQRTEGGPLGHQLLLAGALTRLQLYDALATAWEAPRIDLIAEPPDGLLLRTVPYHVSLRDGWVAHHRGSDGLVVATATPPGEALSAAVEEYFPGESPRYRTTTDWDIWQAVEKAHRDDLLFESQDRLAEDSPLHSAKSGLTSWQLRIPLLIGAVVLVGLLLSTILSFAIVITVANIVFLTSILFKTVAACRAPLRRRRILRQTLAEMQERVRRGLPPVRDSGRPESDLPIYTILMPVYREANIVEKLITNIGSLDYPKSKLDVLLLMEADDHETIEVAKSMRPPEYIRLVVVPPGHPQTKPRACNYGLAFARGEYVVIYDAEDRPESLQLRKSVEAFERDEFERTQLGATQHPLACVQASLHYFNADYNVLTRMFAVEYAHWFEAMLPGMDDSGIPLPLGGTSNHFHTDRLRELGAWDPFNVTEDADLGLRASVLGYRVTVIDSTTGEEACSQTAAWIRQRTRWIKGYMVTAAVNTRHPLQFARDVRLPGVIGMLGLIMATPLAFLVYPICLGFTALTYVGVRFIGLELPGWVVATSVVTMVFGNLLMILSAMVATTWRYNWRIGIFAVFSPIYWVLHSIAAWRALFQVIRDPHRWEKTPHGLTEDYESEAHL